MKGSIELLYPPTLYWLAWTEPPPWRSNWQTAAPLQGEGAWYASGLQNDTVKVQFGEFAILSKQNALAVNSHDTGLKIIIINNLCY